MRCFIWSSNVCQPLARGPARGHFTLCRASLANRCVITRWPLLAYYIAYTLYLVLASSHHHALPRFSAVMLYFVIPLTAVTMATIAFREVRARGR